MLWLMTELQEFEPPRWMANQHRMAAGRAVGEPVHYSPVYYTAPGGWLILNDPQPGTPDRPWKLCRHGVEVERTHTLRIAKSTAHRMSMAAKGAHP